MVPHRIAAAYLSVAALSCSLAIQAQETSTTAASERDQQIRTWIAQLGVVKTWPEAARRLERAGEHAVKPLLDAIGRDGIENTPRTRRALDLLGRMGPDAKAAYPVLAGQVGQVGPKMFVLMWNTLADLAPYSEAQGNQREPQRLIQNAIQILNALPKQDRSRWSAEYTRFHQRILVDADQDVAGLTKLVVQNRVHSREIAVVVLGRMGKRAKSAVPAIAKALRAALKQQRSTLSNALVRKGVIMRSSRTAPADEFPAHAAEAMIRIAPNDPTCAVAYAWRLQHDATDTRRAAAALRVGSFGVHAVSEVPILRKALTDRSARVRWEVITALGMIGPTAKSAVPDLKKILAGKDKGSAARAKAALRQIEKK